MSLLFFPAIAFVLAWPFALIALVGKLGRGKRRPVVSLGIGIMAAASGTIATIYAGTPASSGLMKQSILVVLVSALLPSGLPPAHG